MAHFAFGRVPEWMWPNMKTSSAGSKARYASSCHCFSPSRRQRSFSGVVEAIAPHGAAVVVAEREFLADERAALRHLVAGHRIRRAEQLGVLRHRRVHFFLRHRRIGDQRAVHGPFALRRRRRAVAQHDLLAVIAEALEGRELAGDLAACR